MPNIDKAKIAAGKLAKTINSLADQAAPKTEIAYVTDINYISQGFLYAKLGSSTVRVSCSTSTSVSTGTAIYVRRMRNDKNSAYILEGSGGGVSGSGTSVIYSVSSGGSGSGTANYIPIWSTTTTLGDSSIWYSSSGNYYQLYNRGWVLTSDNSSSGQRLSFQTKASGGSVLNTTDLGQLSWYGWLTSAYSEAAKIAAVVDGTPSAGYVPASIVFYAASASGSLQEHGRMTSAGEFHWSGNAASGKFELDADGDITRIKSLSYDWPSLHANGLLTDDGSGNLTWVPGESHYRLHSIIATADHSVSGSANDLVGLTGIDTLGILTPASTIHENDIPIGGTSGAITWTGLQTFQEGIKIDDDKLVTLGYADNYATLGSTSSGELQIITYTNTAGGNLNLKPAGSVILDPAGNNVVPNLNYDINLGLINKKYLTLHAAELWVETLVAQDTMATIGGRILVGPTTQLVAEVATGDNHIHVKHNQMANGDRVYLEADGKVEFMAITSAPSGTGPYTYTVTRNLDGSSVNAWDAGDAVFNTGATGDGFIDIYSINAVSAIGCYGPTILGNIRNSDTYNDWSPRWAIGNLTNLYDYGSNVYGAAFGSYSGAWISMDSTAGVRVMNQTANTAQWDMSGNLRIGELGATKANLYITGSGDDAGDLDIRLNTTSLIHLDHDGSGYLASNNINWDASGNANIAGWFIGATAITATGVTMTSGANASIAFGATPPVSSISGTGIYVDKTGLYGLTSDEQQIRIEGTTGKLIAGDNKVTLSKEGLTFKAIAASAAGAGEIARWKNNSDELTGMIFVGNWATAVESTRAGDATENVEMCFWAGADSNHTARIKLEAVSNLDMATLEIRSSGITASKLTANYLLSTSSVFAGTASTKNKAGHFYGEDSDGHVVLWNDQRAVIAANVYYDTANDYWAFASANTAALMEVNRNGNIGWYYAADDDGGGGPTEDHKVNWGASPYYKMQLNASGDLRITGDFIGNMVTESATEPGTTWPGMIWIDTS